MAQFGVASSNTLAFKALMSTLFATQMALENPLEAAGMMGTDKNCVIQVLNQELSQGGDKITFHRKQKFTGPGHDEGDPIEGFEQALAFDDDFVLVSEKSFSGRAKTKGTIDDQRTFLDLVQETNDNLVTQAAEWKSWIGLAYLSGKIGTNVTILPQNFTGWAGNTLVDVDSAHQMYGGAASSKATLDPTMTMQVTDLVRLRDKALTLPFKIPTMRLKGSDYNIVLLHPNVYRDLRLSNSGQNLYDVEKAFLQGGADKSTSALIGKAVIIRDQCILIVCEQCMIYTDYGAGANVRASRVLFCGPQAAVWARGKKTQTEEWKFVKKLFEYEKEQGICATTIGGCVATVFASQRHAMIALDVATLAAV
jgi:N4-gp56 family major capsid protein